MKSPATSRWIPFAFALAFLALTVMLPNPAAAQTLGDNIVQGATGTLDSSSFLDASAFTGSDLCARIYAALKQTYPTSPRVVDARGLNSGNTTMTCASGSTPWLQSGVSISPPSIILLPAGTITINTTWTIPSQTQVFGNGPRNTTILANTGFSGDMIDFCSSLCFAVGVSDLMLNGNEQSINGIVNNFAEEQTYVNNVSIHEVDETGIYIGAGGGNSGPYTNLSITSVSSGVAATACVKIEGASTRGVHGMTCTSDFIESTGGPTAGVYLDGDSNTIEDLHFEGFHDGIVVGATGMARGNVIFNVTGSGGGNSGAIDNVVEICSSTAASPCTTSSDVIDLSLLGINANQGQFHTVYMVKDDETNTDIAAPAYPAQGFLGLYALGEKIGSGYSRFVTNTSGGPEIPTWGVGSSAPGSSCAGQNGSIFSNTGTVGTGPGTLWVCVAGVWKAAI
jgi:hypothetical protein